MDTLRTVFLLAGAGWLAHQVFEVVVRPRFRTLAKVPGPRTNLLFGFFALANEVDFVYDVLKWREQFGSTFVVNSAFGGLAVMTGDARAIQHVAVTQVQKYGQPTLVARFLRNALGRGLLTSEGSDHRHQRRVISPAFGDSHVRALTPTFRSLAQILARKWEEATAAGEVELDVHDWMTRFTFDAIGLAGFGYNLNTLDPGMAEPNRLSEAFKTHFERTLGGPLAAAEAALPFLKWLPTARRRKIDEAEALVYAEARRMITEGKSAQSEHKGKRDILSVLLKANSSKDIKPEEQLSDQNIAENVALFMAAGHETGTNAMSFALLNLAHNPRVQEKLRAELLACPQLAPDAAADECTFQVLASLPYLDAVTNEMLRLRIGEPLGMLRAAQEDDVLPLETPIRLTNGKTVDHLPIRKGDIITLPSRNLDPTVWGEDARECRPERWETLSDAAVQLPGWNHLTTFGQGSRNCIGFRFAIIEFKVCMAALVREFVLKPGPRTADVEPRIKLITKPFLKGDDAHPQLPLLVSRYKA